MPAKRQSKKAGSHSVDLGNQSAFDLKSDSTKSGLLSNGAGHDADEKLGAQTLNGGERVSELSTKDIKAIALLVVLCELQTWLLDRRCLRPDHPVIPSFNAMQICCKEYQSDWPLVPCHSYSKLDCRTAISVSLCSPPIHTLSSCYGAL